MDLHYILGDMNKLDYDSQLDIMHWHHTLLDKDLGIFD